MWIIPVAIAVIVCITMSYVIFHDMSIEAEEFVSTWDCDRLEHWLEWDGKKIVNNMFRNEVVKHYEVKCVE